MKYTAKYKCNYCNEMFDVGNKIPEHATIIFMNGMKNNKEIVLDNFAYSEKIAHQCETGEFGYSTFIGLIPVEN